MGNTETIRAAMERLRQAFIYEVFDDASTERVSDDTLHTLVEKRYELEDKRAFAERMELSATLKSLRRRVGHLRNIAEYMQGMESLAHCSRLTRAALVQMDMALVRLQTYENINSLPTLPEEDDPPRFPRSESTPPRIESYPETDCQSLSNGPRVRRRGSWHRGHSETPVLAPPKQMYTVRRYWDRRFRLWQLNSSRQRLLIAFDWDLAPAIDCVMAQLTMAMRKRAAGHFVRIQVMAASLRRRIFLGGVGGQQ
ncbi:hypothetical protein P154DRAFT_534925 [Amniculicola lignicola CBS 123094]|uniref:Uncharacterized protein n=1 Tax=Amniculicola lignicola CBS 123094 TaxID=1392246 RepID=A0A6A5WEG2_9PLEO|nr:hypothetical protein P154DRAFT_534925 [Amniculicola lignicola CBS 123094]